MGQSLQHKIFTETGCIHRDKLMGYHHHSLPAAEKHQVETHLLDCELCSDALDGFALVPAATDSFDELDAEMEQLVGSKSSSSSPQWGKLLVAASIAGLVISTFFLFDYKDKAKQKHLAEQMPVAEELEAEKPKMEKTDKIQARQKQTATEGEEMINPITQEFAYDSRSAEAGEGHAEDTDEIDDLISTLDPEASADSEENRYRKQGNNTAVVGGAVALPLKDRKDNESATAKSGADMAAREMKTLEEESEDKSEMYRSVAEPISTTDNTTRALEKNQDMAKSTKTKAGKSKSFVRGAEMAADVSLESDMPEEKKKKEGSPERDKFIKVNKTDYKIADDAEKDEDNDDKLILVYGEGLPSKYANEESKKKAEEQTPAVETETTMQLTYDEVLKKGITEYDEGNYTEALAQFDLILQHFPNDLNGMFYSGMANYRLSRNEKAQVQYQQVLDANNTTFRQEARWYQALTYEKMNDLTNTRKSLKRIADEEGFYNKQAQEKLDSIE